MNKANNKILYFLVVAVILLSAIAAGIGVFYNGNGEPHNFINQYGDTVKVYGQGIYEYDSFNKGPLFRGTDFAILFFGIPVFIFALIFDIKKQTLKARIFLVSMLFSFAYYSASLAFGVTYNKLFLVYLLLFSASLFGLIVSFLSINMKSVSENVKGKLPYKGIYVFMLFVAIFLFIAWLPDIIQSLLNNRSLALIEVYTTEITYIIDMGILVPIAIACIVLLKKRNGLGYVLFEAMLVLCLLIGVVLTFQSVFQIKAGVEIPLPQLITKAGIFYALTALAIPLIVKLNKSIKY